MLRRYKNELLLKPDQFRSSSPKLKIIGVLNPAVAVHNDEVVLLVRVAEAPVEQRPGFFASPRIKWNEGIRNGRPEYAIDYMKSMSAGAGPSVVEDKEVVRLPHISHLQIVRLARDGYTIKSIETHPELYGITAQEEFGVEDPRLTEIDGVYHFTYVSVGGGLNVCTSLMSTRDFKSFKRHGVIFPCENKDVILHPAKFNGRYVCYHRPVGAIRFTQPSMVSATSDNLTHWGEHRSFMLSGEPPAWDCVRIGGSTPAIRTPKGWLQLYHGVSSGTDKAREYCVGAFLTALDDPTMLIAKTRQPILKPEKNFEINGYISRVVFPTGWIADATDPDKMIVYYGCADTYIAAMTVSIAEILSQLQAV